MQLAPETHLVVLMTNNSQVKKKAPLQAPFALWSIPSQPIKIPTHETAVQLISSYQSTTASKEQVN